MIQTLQDWLTNLANKQDVHADELLVTANQRLSRHILRLRQLQLGVPVLPNQNIASYEQWRSNLWSHCEDRGWVESTVINKQQEQFIWQQLLSQSNQTETLLADNKSLAKALTDARIIVDTWGIPHDQIENANHRESSFFLEVRTSLSSLYQEKGWITPEQQSNKLIDLFNTGTLKKYSDIGLYGFTELNPLQQALVSSATNNVQQLPIEKCDQASAGLIECVDWETEIETIARWAHQTLKQNPSTQIGIVIPNLQKHRSQIECAFIRQFDNDYLLNPTSSGADKPYELSIGSPLAEEPCIADALLLTQLLHKKLTKEEALDLIRSEFWGQNTEARLLALQGLNDWPMTSVDTIQLTKLLSKAEKRIEAANDLNIEQFKDGFIEATDEMTTSNRILEAIQLYRLAAHKLDFQHWNGFLKRFLKTLNWPGNRTLNSREYQAVEQFKLILDELLVDQRCFIGSNLVTFPAYVAHLRQRLSEKVFQQQTPRKPIQISGTLEAIGLSFDKCWVANTTRSQFPESPQPNAFLPLALQKAFATPRSSPQKELDYAEQLLTIFSECANEVTFSYSKTAEDEHQQVSPLLPPMASKKLDEEQLAKNLYFDKYNTASAYRNFCVFSDLCGLPLKHSEASIKIRRGVNALSTYAVNPLYAYLVHRLGAKQPNPVYVGISPPQRGNILHNVLETFWEATKNSAALKTKLENQAAFLAELEALISDNVNAELHKHLQYLPPQLLELEKQRCLSVLVQWLTLESYRAPFIVAATENAYAIELKPISFNVRVDRVDSPTSASGEPTGNSILIDYKTGSTPLSLLQRAPLVEPQLPVYTQLKELSASAVALGQLQPNNCTFVGIGEDAIQIDGVDAPSKLNKYDLPDTWEKVLDWWQQELMKSVKGFSEGNALNITTVKTYENRFEHLQPIVRKTEQEKMADISKKAEVSL